MLPHLLTKPAGMLYRGLLWLLSAAITLSLSSVLFLLLLLQAPAGLGLVQEVATQLLGERLAIGGMEGRLAGPLELRDLRYRDQETELTIGRLYLAWQPVALFRGEVLINELGLEQVTAHSGAGDSSGAIVLPDVSLPLRLRLQQGRVLDLQLVSADATTQIDVIQLGAEMQADLLHINSMSVRLPQGQLQGSGDIRLAGDYPLQLAVKWRYPVPDMGDLSGQGTLAGDLRSLQIRQRLGGLLQAELDLTLEQLLDEPVFQGDLRLQRLGDALIARAGLLTGLSGRVALNGNLQGIAAEGELLGAVQDVGDLAASYDVAWEGGRLRVRQLQIRLPEGGIASLSGDWQPGDGGGDLALKGDWQALAWPLSGPAEFSSPEGELQLEGRVDDYRLRLDGRLQGGQLPDARLQLTAEGDRRRLQIADLRLLTLDGAVTGSGQLAWDPRPEWSLQLSAAAIHPALQWPDWPGQLAGQLSIDGQLTAGELSLELRIDRLQGELRGYPLQAAGRLALQGENLVVDQLNLQSGPSRLQASGRIADRWDLQWSLESTDLASLYPDLAGTLSADGRLSGARERPGFSARLNGQGLSFQGYSMASLKGVAELDPQAGDRFHLDLQAADLSAAGRRWQRLQLRGAGTRAEHRLVTELIGKGGQVKLQLDGGLSDRQQWRGQLSSLQLQGDGLGEWRLQQPASLQLSVAELSLERSCLVQGAASLCVELQGGKTAAWQGQVVLSRLDIASLRPLLPPDLRLQGESNGKLEFSSDDSGRLRGQLLLSIPRWQADFQGEQLLLADSRLDGRVDADGAALQLSLPLGKLGQVDGRLALPGWSSRDPGRTSQPLEGRLQAQFGNLSVLAAHFPGIADLQGRLDGDLSLAGTLGRPALEGQMSLQEAAFDVPALGIRLQGLNLQARNEGKDQLVYRGRASSGQGELTLSGSTRLDPARGWPTKLMLKGNDVLVADIPEAWILASPDLQFTLDNEANRLTGEVLIPRARIRPRALPETAITPSPDIRIVQGAEVAETSAAPPLSATVRLRFGDRVSFDGFGLRGLIRGDIEVRDEPGQLTLGNGQIRIEEGTYTAYGQDLEIQRGRLIFASSPVANPGVELRALRRISDVEVGVRVTGTLKEPELKVFSNPPMAQSDALAYMLFGGPLDRKSSTSDKQRLNSAASALAVGGGGWLAAEIGRQLGLDQFSLQTGEESDLALHMGTYLSPRLYVQYITELTASTNTVRLRYDLTDKLQVETEAGSVQGVDLFYTIEK